MINNGNMFDELLAKTKKFTDKAGKKISETLDLSKMKIEIANITNAINADYKSLGECVYNAQNSGADISEEISVLTDKINIKQERLSELREQYEMFRKIKVCSFCGAKNPQEAQYCSSCGKEI